MNSRIGLLMGAALSFALLASCGGSGHGGTPPVTMMPSPPPPPPKQLDTAALLTIIQTQTSETADPFEVNDAAVEVTPAGDETGAPVSIEPT